VHALPLSCASVPRRQAGRTEKQQRSRSANVNVPPLSNHRSTCATEVALDRFPDQMLLRKEVIQPHLPVRLPCYDLVLITDPTFDGSLHKG
jgi:hypothetical protein